RNFTPADQASVEGYGTGLTGCRMVVMGKGSKMRIGLIAPPWFAVPPSGYGGIEWVVSHLADGLTERGHDVTLFASGGSRTIAEFVPTYPHPPSELLGDPVVEACHLLDSYSSWRDFDIIHDHTMLGLLAGAILGDETAVVHTIHGEVSSRMRPFYARVGRRVHLVCISENQRSTLPLGSRATVIHNGIRVADFPFSDRPGDYLLFVGRMSPSKGILDALEIARRSGRRIVVIAKVNEEDEKTYFRDTVRPAMEGVNVDLLFETPPEVKAEAYRGAYATLFPIHWPEPFGLIMTESMATGTPVIAFRNGSVPEVIDDGVTGIICDSIDQAVAALDRVPELDRRACRDRVERQFEASVNVERHEALYRSLLAGGAAGGQQSIPLAVAGGGEGA
ncbi:MAG TPA: glycosyltransferase family 4 protein, partial [Tepidiformaceae bacterium]|nr:glycosyltransferase family 4 protein [Tepidiformaceae bacterium]